MIGPTALLTDHYELTMLDAALRAGTGELPVVFEVFTRALPPGRRYAVFAGLERLLDLLERFRFDADELEWLGRRRLVSDATLEWLSRYRFAGDVIAYREGELYTAGSPVLSVCGTFAETVLLETVTLSVLNHDSAVASAASVIATAAGERPVIEMGSRRTDPDAAVASARAAYIGGFASTSNLEAGRRYGIPTAGTAAHSFVLLFPDEQGAFQAQVDAMGPSTTLLVDTFDTEKAIRLAVEVAGADLAAVRIDSGNLGEQAARARAQLDGLGAPRTKVVVTGDLDERSIAGLSAAPVDAYGAGTSVVLGGGHPTSGLVYKLAEVDGRPVGKLSPGKETVGGKKQAWRLADEAVDVVTTGISSEPAGGRFLQDTVVAGGRRSPRSGSGLAEIRDRHRRSLLELGPGRTLRLDRRT